MSRPPATDRRLFSENSSPTVAVPGALRADAPTHGNLTFAFTRCTHVASRVSLVCPPQLTDQQLVQPDAIVNLMLPHFTTVSSAAYSMTPHVRLTSRQARQPLFH